MRPLGFADPSDRILRSVDDAYMLGRDLLVVPVFSDSAEPVERTFYLPAGQWTDLITGDWHAGPGFVTRTCKLAEMPLLVRDGTVLPRLDVTPAHRNTDDLLELPWRYDVFGAVAEPRTFVGFDGAQSIWHPVGGSQ